MKVLIDGENFRHQLAHVLYEHGKLPKKNEYFSFDINGFLHEVLHGHQLKPVYYTTRLKHAERIPVRLKRQIDVISKANRRWIADLTNADIKVVKAGYLRVRESSACVHCGKKTLVLQEKGVDVRVAIDLVLNAAPRKQLALMSSDSDLVPALEAAKKAGVHTYYICYAGWVNRSVSAVAYKTITFDDDVILKHHKEK